MNVLNRPGHAAFLLRFSQDANGPLSSVICIECSNGPCKDNSRIRRITRCFGLNGVRVAAILHVSRVAP